MKEQQFDDIIKQQLQDLKVNDSADWTDFNEKLDFAEKQVEDQLFDEKVKRHINNLEQPYNDVHWHMLDEWMSYTWMTTTKLYFSKLAEVGLMMLILYTCCNYQRINQFNQYEQNVYAEQSKQQNETSIENQSEKYNTAALTPNSDPFELNTVEKQSTTNNQIDFLDSKLEKSNNISDKSEEIIIKILPEKTAAEIIQAEEGFAVNNTQSSANDLENIHFVSQEKSLPSNNTVNAFASINNELLEIVNADLLAVDYSFEDNNYVAPIAFLNTDNIDSDLNLETTSTVIGRKSNANNYLASTKHNGLYMKIGGGAELNQINTPYDKVYQSRGSKQQNLGHAVGLLLGRELKNHFGFETGLIYSSRAYNPKDIVEIHSVDRSATVSTQYSIDKIEYNLLTVPLQLTYKVKDSDKWSSYIAVGAAANIALQANYNKEQTVLAKNAAFPADAERTFGSQPKIEAKEFNDGILEGGSFADNHFYSVNVGLGIERKFNKRFSVFLQPTFNYNVFNKGLGPNNDKIHALNVLAGAKINLGKIVEL